MREFIVVAVIFGSLAAFALAMDNTSTYEETVSVVGNE